MRVLNVNTTLDPVHGGGMAERTYQMSRFLAKAGVDCAVLATDLGLTPERLEALHGVEVLALPCLSKRFYIPEGPYEKIWDFVQAADVVHLMGHWSALNTIVSLMAGRLRIPYVVCPAGALPIYGRSKVMKRIYNAVIGKRLIRRASGHIAIAPVEVDQFGEYGVASDRISVIPNGVDEEEFSYADGGAFRRRFDLGDAPLILFMGRLNAIKGPDLLLEAFCRCRDTVRDRHLVFVGPDDGMRDALEERAGALGITDRVHFTGYLGGSEKSQAYHAAELLVIPSRQEAMSIVVLEAGIAGTPVLITEPCGFGEVAKTGGGQVVPPTVQGLRDGLTGMLQNPELLKGMGDRLKEHVRKHFAWPVIASKYAEELARHVKRFPR